MWKMCFNPKVLAGLGVVAITILIVNPNVFAAALPLLFLAACPLSMLLMGKMMTGQASSGGAAGVYTCPMHPEVQSDKPGRCPKCGMALTGRRAESEPAPTSESEPERLRTLEARLENLREQQAALGREMNELQAAKSDSVPVPVEAGRVAERSDR